MAEEIGSLVVSLRTESAAFRAEMDKARGSVKGIGTEFGLSQRRASEFATRGLGQIADVSPQLSRALGDLTQRSAALGRAVGAIGLALFAKDAFELGLAIGENLRHLVQYGELWATVETRLKSVNDEQRQFLVERKRLADLGRSVDASLTASRAGLAVSFARGRGDLAGVATAELHARLGQLATAEDTVRRQIFATTQMGAEREAFLTKNLLAHIDLRNAAYIDHFAAIEKLRETETAKATSAFERASTTFGIGDTGLLAGFKKIRDLTEDTRAFGEGIRDLAKQGVPARDIFTEITRAQDGLDKKMAELAQEFRDQPPLLEALRQSLGALTFGGFQRDLDASVRSLQGVSQGSANFVDSLAATAASLTSAQQPLVIVTGHVNALAQAFASARLEAILFSAEVGQSVDLGRSPGGSGFRVVLPPEPR